MRPDGFDRGDSLPAFVVCLLALVVLVACACASAKAQDVPPDLQVPDVQLPATGEILALDQGDRAPHAGMLVLDDDLVAWRQAIERLSFRVAAITALDAQTLSLRLDQERARTTAATERAALRDQLWSARVEELTASLAASQARQGPAWYEQPLLWVVVGAVLGGALVGLVAAATH